MSVVTDLIDARYGHQNVLGASSHKAALSGTIRDFRGSRLRQGQTTRMYGEDIGFCCSALTAPRR